MNPDNADDSGLVEYLLRALNLTREQAEEMLFDNAPIITMWMAHAPEGVATTGEQYMEMSR